MERVRAWLNSLRAEAGSSPRLAVTLSYAQSLDGNIISQDGAQKKLNGPETKKMVHMLRSAHDAILVGIGTVLADNPRLEVRLTEGQDPRPVILDTHLRIPLDSHLMQRKDLQPWIACGANADEEKWGRIEERKARVIPCRLDAHKRVSLEDLLDRLRESGIRSIMVEGGAKVITSFIEARLVDVAVITVVPLWLGRLHVVEKELEENQGLELMNPNSAWMGKDLVLYGAIRQIGKLA